MSYAVVVEGLEDLASFEKDFSAENIRFNAVRAINGMAERARREGKARILEQVNFPASYLNPAGKRFMVSRKATGNNLEAAVAARFRPTSLARFVTGTMTPNKPGVTVEVHPGKSRFMKRAFVIKLPAGSAGLDTKSNFGLAVRLKKGDTLRNKRNVVRMARGLYLLYGPSVQQVFLDNQGEGVAADLQPEIRDRLADEFLRLMDL